MNICSASVQKTPEWIREKIKTIGGASIYIVMQDDKTYEKRDLAAQKCGLIENAGLEYQPAIMWGSVMEPAIQRVAEVYYNCRIFCSSSFYICSNGYQSYSPDGLAIIKHIEKYGRYKLTEDAIALFEFKCPACRTLTAEVPEKYIAQVQYGLNVLPIDIRYGIYFEATFKRCRLRDLSFDNLDYNIFKLQKNQIQPEYSEVLGIGMIFFRRSAAALYKNTAEYIEQSTFLADYYKEDAAKALIKAGGGEVIDCGAAYTGTILHIFEDHIKGGLIADHSMMEISLRDSYNDTNEEIAATDSADFVDRCLEKIDADVIAIMPWKLFEVNTKIIEKNADFGLVAEAEVRKFFNKIDTIKSAPSAEEKTKLFKEYFCNGRIKNMDKYTFK